MKQHTLFPIAKAQLAVAGFGDNPDIIPALGYSRGLRRAARRAGKLGGISGTSAERKMRKERRAAAEAVIIRMLHLSDPARCAVQVPISAIAEWCGLCPRRVNRIIRDLRDNGVLRKVRQPKEKIGGEWRNGVAVRRWGNAFLRLLRVNEMWAKWGKWKRDNPPPDTHREMRTEAWQWQYTDAAAKMSARNKAPPRARKKNATPSDYGKNNWLDVIRGGSAADGAGG